MATAPTSIETNGTPPPRFVWPQWLRGRWDALGSAAVVFAVWTFFHWGGEEAKAVISGIARDGQLEIRCQVSKGTEVTLALPPEPGRLVVNGMGGGR